MMNNNLEVLIKLLEAKSRSSYDIASVFDDQGNNLMAIRFKKESLVYDEILMILRSDHLLRELCDLYGIEYEEETV